MKYTLDTIPVLDAYRTDCECPLCRLQMQCEDQYIDSLLNSAYMEPEWRVKTNQTGFCTRHFAQMFDRRNRLGLALMTHTHMQEVITSVEGILAGKPARGGLLRALRGGDAASSPAAAIRARMAGCAVCEQIDTAMARYAYTVAQLYGTNDEFRAMFTQSKGLCLPHLALVLETAEQTLRPAQVEALQKALAELTLTNLRRVEADLSWFTRKFDYRNQDAPWGNSRDAVERGINKLMGACVGEEAQPPAHND